MITLDSFADNVLRWYEQHGRKDFPWQKNPSAYKTWVSEVMLQQTQVITVIPYYDRFIASFPTVKQLASADIDAVLEHWAGLGYYSRARNLHKAAQQMCSRHDSQVPDNLDELCALSGIGRSTAGAILSLAYDQTQPILDGNVKRVLARYHAVKGWTGKAAISKQLWALAEQHLPEEQNAHYTQAMMDLGATVCTRQNPSCESCPLATKCLGLAEGEPCHYPEPKPKKVIPHRTAYFLYLVDEEGQLLLEKRPPTGIWGGLWCLPQFETQNELVVWLQDNIGAAQFLSKLPSVRHVFSHFKLHIIPLHYKTTTKSHGVMEADQFLWYNTLVKLQGGLPAPINTLIKDTK